jgi:hypothetical protein
LEGSGRYEPALVVSPGAASGGQVVLVLGSGYPASTEIGVTLGGASVTVVSDVAGEFMSSWLVRSGLPQGEMIADDVAVIDRYDAESEILILIGSPVRPQSTATLSQSIRRHVSR